MFMKIISRVAIDTPVKKVWDFFDNPDNMHLWLTGFKRFEPLSGKQGEVGATAKHVYEDRGRTIEMIEEITRKDMYRRFHGTLKHSSMTSLIETEFIDVNGTRTEMIATVDVTFHSFLFKLMSPLMKGAFQKRQDGDFVKFKSCVESR